MQVSGEGGGLETTSFSRGRMAALPVNMASLNELTVLVTDIVAALPSQFDDHGPRISNASMEALPADVLGGLSIALRATARWSTECSLTPPPFHCRQFLRHGLRPRQEVTPIARLVRVVGKLANRRLHHRDGYP